MTKVFLKVIAIFVILLAQQASAQVFGTYQYVPAAGVWVRPQPVILVPAHTHTQSTQISITAGGLSGCNIIGGLAGLAIGREAVNYNTAASVLGMIGGGLLGGKLCESKSGEAVYVPKGQEASKVALEKLSSCTIKGLTSGPKTIRGLTEEQCTSAGEEATKSATGKPAQKAIQTAGTTPYCPMSHKGETKKIPNPEKIVCQKLLERLALNEEKWAIIAVVKE